MDMDSKIQQLTEAIYNEGVQKARDEAGNILKEAQMKAAQMEDEATKAAAAILSDAQKKSKELKNHVESEIRLTIQQAITALKQQISHLITLNLLQPSINELFSDKEYLRSLISSVIQGWSATGSPDLHIILPASSRDKMEEYLQNSLADQLNKGVSFKWSHDFKSGFKIGPEDESYLISFSDEDFLNFLKMYLRPKTAHLLFGEEK